MVIQCKLQSKEHWSAMLLSYKIRLKKKKLEIKGTIYCHPHKRDNQVDITIITICT